jgi:hypothetical protein
MGLDLKFCLSPESHIGEFTCLICCSLLDLECTVTEPCSHAFCSSCLSKWLKKGYRCPTCNEDIGGVGGGKPKVGPMNKLERLAFRVLRRVKVKCPGADFGCSWTGDYADLQQHMVSAKGHESLSLDATASPASSSGPSSTPSSGNYKQLAVVFKERGGEKFSDGHYADAGALYTSALDLFPPQAAQESDGLYVSLLANRAACSLMVGDHRACVEDCEKVRGDLREGGLLARAGSLRGQPTRQKRRRVGRTRGRRRV